MRGERGRVGRSEVDLRPEGRETVAVVAATMGGGRRSGENLMPPLSGGDNNGDGGGGGGESLSAALGLLGKTRDWLPGEEQRGERE
jgi:hypothetical protein